MGAPKIWARLVLPRPNRYYPVSPDKFCADLPDARIASGGDVAKGAAADIPTWIYELRVVEDVEEFAPNLESLCLRHGYSLLQPEIGVVESRPMKESPISSAECATFTGQHPIR